MNITTGKVSKAQKVVLYGTEGIGKSTFASQFPNPLFIDTEGSTGNMDVARMDKPTSYMMLQQQIQFVKMQRPCQTLVIDTIDWAERLITDYICEKGQKDSITKFGYGEGFIQLEEEIGRFLNSLQDLVDSGINVLLTAHAKITKFEQPDEMGAYDRYELKLGNKTTAKTAALVKEWADMVLFANYKTFSVATDDKGKKHKGTGGVRTIFANHHPAWDAKNRHDLPDEFPMDYGQIAHVFNGQIATNVPPQQQQVNQKQQKTQQQAEIQTQTNVVPETTTQQTNDTVAQNEPVGTMTMPQNNPTAQTTSEPSQDFTRDSAPSNIPKPLLDLMTPNGVTEFEIQQVVSSKGYYPLDTPIANYDPGFIQGVLVAAWDQVYPGIEEIRKTQAF